MTRLRLLPPAEVADTPEQAAPILEQLMNRGGALAVDTETTGLDIMRDRVLFWSLATEDRRFCFPQRLLLFFDPLFQRSDITWYMANAKYDMHLMSNMGIDIEAMGPIWDIIVMDAMDDDTRPHGLKEQALFNYEVSWGDFKDLFLDPHLVSEKIGLDKRSFTQFKKLSVGEKLLHVYAEDPTIVEDYASCDAYFTYLLGEELKLRLSSDILPTDPVDGMVSMLDYFVHLEVPLTRCLWEMERNGFLVDTDYLDKIDGPMRDGIQAAKNKVYRAAGTEFSVTSPDELREIIYGEDYFGLPAIKYTTGGNTGEPKLATDEKTLEILRDRCQTDSPPYRFLDAVMDFKHIDKLHNTYVKKLLKRADRDDVESNPNYSIGERINLGPDGRVHCRLNQAGARTSRLSSADPNMQNIPQRNDPYKIRNAFIADPGEELLDYDYPQIEFRIAAVLAGEVKMMDNIRKGWDIHSANAATMYADAAYEAIMEARRKKDAKEPLTTLDKQMLKYRGGAKTVGLGVMYGEGPRKMAASLGIEKEDAEAIIYDFFNTFGDLNNLIHFMHEYAKDNGFTYTMLGRKRYLHRITNPYSHKARAAEERQAFNTLIQGSGAEMMKLAILRVGASKEFRQLGGKLKLTVHDELIGGAPKGVSKDAGEIMQSLMADPFRWGPIDLTYPVPVDPDGSVGERWGELK